MYKNFKPSSFQYCFSLIFFRSHQSSIWYKRIDLGNPNMACLLKVKREVAAPGYMTDLHRRNVEIYRNLDEDTKQKLRDEVDRWYSERDLNLTKSAN